MSDIVIYKGQEDTKVNEGKLSEIRELYKSLPFGNSTLQDEVFALGGEDEKCPWLRAKKAAINLEGKLDALEENIHLKKMSILDYQDKKIDYDKLSSKLIKSAKDRIQLQRLALEVEKAEKDAKKKENLFLDCVRKVDLFAANLLKCKAEIEARGEVFSYEGYDAHDRKNFETRLIRQFTYSVWAGQPSMGDISSLAQLGVKVDYDPNARQVTEVRRLGQEELKQLTAPSITGQDIVDNRIENHRKIMLEHLEKQKKEEEDNILSAEQLQELLLKREVQMSKSNTKEPPKLK